MISKEQGIENPFFLTVEIKYYNVMIDGRNFFDHPVKNDATTCKT